MSDLESCIAARRAAPAGQQDASNAVLMSDAAQWREMLACVMAEMPQRFHSRGNAPGHAHSEPGIWDSDNGVLAGKECAWCKVWNAARKALAAETELASPVPRMGGHDELKDVTGDSNA